MNSSDNYIIITESHDLDNGSVNSGEKIQDEPEDASLRALEDQGISILENTESSGSEEPFDQFSKELLREGDIEIVTGDEEEESFL